MPNKKKQRNGFYFFMKYLQEKYAADGVIYTMSSLPEIAHPIWKALSVEEREVYDMQAKTFKLGSKALSTRYASDGTPVQQLFDEEAENIQKENEMRHAISEFLSVVPGTPKRFQEVIPEKIIYILTFNILCCTDDKEYIPLEIGAAKYSISAGIMGYYHKFIYPGPIPTGYAGEAKRHSDETHQIPINGHEQSVKDYGVIVKELIEFLNPKFDDDRSFPPTFCLKKDIPQTLGSISWLAKKSRYTTLFEDFKVWDLAYLFFKIREGSGSVHRLPSYFLAEEFLTKNTFDYTNDTRCSYHDDLDIVPCALGYSKRLCYLLSDALCACFNITATGSHLPTVEGVKPYEYHFPNFRDMRLDERPPLLRDPPSNLYERHSTPYPDARNESNLPEIRVPSPIGSLPLSHSRRVDTPIRQPQTMSVAQMLSSQALKSVAQAPGTGIGRGVKKT